MENKAREYPLFSACGLNCGLCPRHHTVCSSRCPGCAGDGFSTVHPTCGLLSIQEICASCELENIPVRFYDFIESSRAIKGYSLPINFFNAIEYAKNCTTFSEGFIKQLHGILATSEISDSKYRYNQEITKTDIFNRYGSHPIPADTIQSAMREMEKYISSIEYKNALLVAARIHYQLEILDPFDKYSRTIARIIAVSALRWGGLLSHPALWLSAYLHDLTIEYRDRIVATYRQGEELFSVLWIKFFLIAVIASSNNAIRLIESLTSARNEHKEIIPHISHGNKSTDTIFEYVANTIIVNVRQISDALGLSFSSVTKVVKAFEEAGILRQVTQKERYRQFGYAPVLDMIEYV